MVFLHAPVEANWAAAPQPGSLPWQVPRARKRSACRDPSCCFRCAHGILDPAKSGSITCAAWQSRSVGPPQPCRTPGLPPCLSSRGVACQHVSLIWRLWCPGPFLPCTGARAPGIHCPPTPSPPHHTHHDGISCTLVLRFGPWGLSQCPGPWNRTVRVWDQCRVGTDAQICIPSLCQPSPTVCEANPIFQGFAILHVTRVQ